MSFTIENDDELRFNLRSFSDEIERLVLEKKMEYIDAVLMFCENNMIDVDVAANFIKNNSRLKGRIQDEAEKLNFLPKSSKLPL